MANIHVGILARDVKDADLVAFFVANDTVVTDAHVCCDKMSKRSRRIGRAQAADPADVIAKCNGKLLAGFSVTVSELK